MTEQPTSILRNYKAICNVVLYGTYLLVAAISVLLLARFSIDHNHQVLERLLVCGGALVYMAATQVLLHRNHYHVVAYLLISFYTLLAGGMAWSWGINTPMSLLMFGLVIVLAGILLSARHALFAALVSGLILIGTQTAVALHWHKPAALSGHESSFADIFAYGTVFSMLALVSWLYNREMERSLAAALAAEAALQRQKATLEIQVKKRTAQLRQAQLEEMRQMYRFAELGQMGVTLLHDLANHLTALTLEIEGMQNKQQTKAIARSRRIIQYLGNIVDNTRERLHGDIQEQTFNIIQMVNEVVAFLNYKAAKANVTIDWQPPARSWEYVGDPASLSQVIAIITSNAIDAYGHTRKTAKERRVAIMMQRSETHIIIKISDWGKGITKSERKSLFKPFRSGKKSGLGIGLFIARQTVQTQFSGKITLAPKTSPTEFIIKLPLSNDR